MTALLVALLLTSGGGSTGPDPSFPKPAIHHIRVSRDTVWFEGNRGFDTVSIRYCFVRRTGAWCRLPSAPPGVSPERSVPATPGDSVRVAPGLTLVCRSEAGSGCETYGLVSAADRREHWLVPRITPAARESLLEAIELETDEPPSMSLWVTAHAAGDEAIWFGLGGGFPEGEGAFGGLLRFDRAHRTVETIIHPGLGNATVTGLAIVRGDLWVGTLHPGEYGPWGKTGILCRDLRSGRWSAIDSATTPLPDNLVQTLVADDDQVFVATRDGLAVFDAATRRWTVRYFRRAIIADSIVYALAVARPADEPGDEALFVVMEALGVTRREAFAAAMRSTGTERLRAVLTGESMFEDALAHPALVPFLVDALAKPRTSGLAARSLARVGDRRVVPALRAALARSGPGGAGAPLAAALVRLGDAGGLTWLHASLHSAAPWHAKRDAITFLAEIRDSSSVAPIMSLLVDPEAYGELRRAAAEGLRAYQSPTVWRRMADAATRERSARPLLVNAADSTAVRDSVAARAIGDFALELLDSVNTRSRLYNAIRIAAQLRPREAVPRLVRAVSDSVWGGTAAHELVRVTGVTAAPTIDPWRERGRRAAEEFWTAWWGANGTSYDVVTPDAGERAYRAWAAKVRERTLSEYEQRRGTGRRG